jgi:hypothetical protein
VVATATRVSVTGVRAGHSRFDVGLRGSDLQSRVGGGVDFEGVKTFAGRAGGLSLSPVKRSGSAAFLIPGVGQTLFRI